MAAIASALLVGFLAGLISFKVKRRWCPDCGAMTVADVPGRITPLGSQSYDRVD